MRSTKISLVGGALCFLGLIDYQANAQNPVVFENAFEGSDNQVAASWGNSAAAVRRILDPGPFDSAGNHVFKIRVPANTQQEVSMSKDLSGYDKLYVRWYMKFAANYDFANGARHGSYLYAGAFSGGTAGYIPTGDNAKYGAGVEPKARPYLYSYYRGMPCTNGSPPGPTCWGIAFDDPGKPAVVAGQWFCVELMVDGGTPTPTAQGASGALDFWVNNRRYGPWGGLWFRSLSTLQLGTFALKLYTEPPVPYDVVAYYDKVIISTKRIGPVGGPGDTTIPAVPTNLKATAVSATQINLAWTDNSYNETGFMIEKKVSPTGGWTTFDTVGNNVTSCPSTRLSANHVFRYRIRAYNDSTGKSAYSNIDSAATLSAGMFAWPAQPVRNGASNSLILAMSGLQNQVLLGANVKKIEAYNTSGKRVWQHFRGAAAGEAKIALPSELAGVFYLKYTE